MPSAVKYFRAKKLLHGKNTLKWQLSADFVLIFFLLNVMYLFFCQIFQFASTLRHRLVRPSTENFEIQSREICLSTFLNYYIKSLMHNLWGSKWSRSSASSGYFFFPLETWSPKRVSNPFPGPWKQSTRRALSQFYSLKIRGSTNFM